MCCSVTCDFVGLLWLILSTVNRTRWALSTNCSRVAHVYFLIVAWRNCRIALPETSTHDTGIWLNAVMVVIIAAASAAVSEVRLWVVRGATIRKIGTRIWSQMAVFTRNWFIGFKGAKNGNHYEFQKGHFAGCITAMWWIGTPWERERQRDRERQRKDYVSRTRILSCSSSPYRVVATRGRLAVELYH
jgi:hypothetical protein